MLMCEENMRLTSKSHGGFHGRKKKRLQVVRKGVCWIMR